MEYNFKGNPGTGNTFQDTRMEQVANYNPNALQVTNNFQAPVTRHRSQSGLSLFCKSKHSIQETFHSAVKTFSQQIPLMREAG